MCCGAVPRSGAGKREEGRVKSSVRIRVTQQVRGNPPRTKSETRNLKDEQSASLNGYSGAVLLRGADGGTAVPEDRLPAQFHSVHLGRYGTDRLQRS